MTIDQKGPAGGFGGAKFEDYIIPAKAKMTQIDIYTSHFINAIQVHYSMPGGDTRTLDRIGGSGGEKNFFTFQEDEYLIGISGRCGWYVDSLCLHTNKRTSEPFGGNGGESTFRFEVSPGQEIAGFFGQTDWYVDAIGILIRSRKPQRSAPPKREPNVNDLKKVEGIGPKIASILAENGIPDLQSLAEAEVGELKRILKEAGRRYALADPSTWPEQAALGAKGDWEGMEALKKKLKRGKRT